MTRNRNRLGNDSEKNRNAELAQSRSESATRRVRQAMPHKLVTFDPYVDSDTSTGYRLGYEYRLSTRIRVQAIDSDTSTGDRLGYEHRLSTRIRIQAIDSDTSTGDRLGYEYRLSTRMRTNREYARGRVPSEWRICQKLGWSMWSEVNHTAKPLGAESARWKTQWAKNLMVCKAHVRLPSFRFST